MRYIAAITMKEIAGKMSPFTATYLLSLTGKKIVLAEWRWSSVTTNYSTKEIATFSSLCIMAVLLFAGDKAEIVPAWMPDYKKIECGLLSA